MDRIAGKLLILLLLSPLAWGQTVTTEAVAPYVLTNSDLPITYNGLLILWDAYKAERQLDSVWDEGWYIMVDSTTMIDIGDGQEDYAAKLVNAGRWRYYPRSKDFPGFMDFLKKRYGRTR